MSRDIPKSKWKPARGISPVDKRLASQLHLRQIETLLRSETIADKAVREANKVADRLTRIVSNDVGSFAIQQAIQSAIPNLAKDTKRLLTDEFEKLAYWSHGTLVNAYLNAVPLDWFAGAIPPDRMRGFEEMHFPEPAPPILEFNHLTGIMQVVEVEQADRINIPIKPLRKAKLSDKQKRQVIKQLLFKPPSIDQVIDLLSTPGPDGIAWQERIETLSKKVTNNTALFNQITQVYADGASVAKIRQSIEPLVSGIRSSAQRIARTEGCRIANRIQRQSWDDLGDMFGGVQILAVLDENTRPHHATRNGTIYRQNPGPGERPLAELPDLPDAANCRCWDTPVLNPPPELQDDAEVRAAFQADTAGTLDPGSYVDWWKGVDAGRRKEVVGRKRYDWMVDQVKGVREPEFADFVNDEGRILPLTDLKNETSLDREIRKQKVRNEIILRGQQRFEVSKQGFIFDDDRRRFNDSAR